MWLVSASGIAGTSHLTEAMKKEAASRQKILSELTKAEEKLAGLRRQQKEVEVTINSLREGLEHPKGQNAHRTMDLPFSQVETSASLTPDEKIGLFRGLFRGREDVYAKLWINKTTGKKGYAPACDNEWRKGVCDKKQVKCADCANQAFLPVTNDALLDHLQGRHTIGVYPMLRGENCWFLAADFDKEMWRDDVLAFTETCRDTGLPYAIEVSRSGEGAHVWFFFSSAVPASIARRMGSHLITETMFRRHQLGMSSYDRLFPNQDTLPKGGFGNLIALPLQYHPRQEGNTLFLDDELKPRPDQWGFLASVHRIPVTDVERIANEAATKGLVIGVPVSNTGEDDDDAKPWLRTPSRKPGKVVITEPIPPEVGAVLSQRLFVEKRGLPSPLINQIKQLAAFQNPEFYKKQNLRLSTARTPRVIVCSEELAKHISLPRGCLEDVKALLQGYESRLVLDDQRIPGDPIEVSFHGRLTDAQKQAVKAILAHDDGVIVAPPGFGKTVLGTYLIAERKCNTLILVHRQPLLEQWRSQIGIFLGLDSKSIGQIGAGKRKITGRIDVAMIQSLSRKNAVDDMIAQYGQVIIDECHHLPAASFEALLFEAKARHVLGLTATPQRRDGHQPIIHMHLGPVRYKIDPRSLLAERHFEHRLVVKETDYHLPDHVADISIQALYSLLVGDQKRNEQIINDVLLAMEDGRSPLLLTERKDHVEQLHKQLKGFVRNIIVLTGGRSAKERREIQEQLSSIPDGEERLLLATGRYIGEGFDDARLDTLFLGLPVSWKGTLVQYAGRLHRLHPGKHELRIVDYVDSKVPMLARMFKNRLRGYRAMGYGEVEDQTIFG